MGDGQSLSSPESSPDAFRRGRSIRTSQPDYHTEFSALRDETHLMNYHPYLDFIDKVVPSPPITLSSSSHSDSK